MRKKKEIKETKETQLARALLDEVREEMISILSKAPFTYGDLTEIKNRAYVLETLAQIIK